MRRIPPMTSVVLIGALAFATPTLSAESESDGLWVRAGALSEGPQHTFRKGIELGAGYDWRSSSWYAVGLGVGFANQPDQFGYAEYDARALSVEGHVRWSLGRARVRPHLEMGLGYYRFDWHARWQPADPAFDSDWSAPGLWLGIGAGARLTERVTARLGIAYHMIGQNLTVEGGNLDDYFATGLTLVFGIPRR